MKVCLCKRPFGRFLCSKVVEMRNGVKSMRDMENAIVGQLDASVKSKNHKHKLNHTEKEVKFYLKNRVSKKDARLILKRLLRKIS